MPSIPRGQDVQLTSLQVGNQIGDGGQGTVYLLRNHPDLVYKKYKVNGVNPAALQALVNLPASMSAAEVDILNSFTAWPYARVMSGGAAVGLLMPIAPQRFFGRTQAGPKLRAVQYLLYPPKPMWGEIRPLDIAGRLHLVHKIVALFKVLHDRQVVVGDISMNNMLWSDSADPDIFMIDCDGARVSPNPAPLSQPDTPDWGDPLTPPAAADLDSDAYKLALLIGRVISGTAYAKPGERLVPLPGLVDRYASLIIDLYDRAGGPKGSRPTAGQWYGAVVTGREQIQLGKPVVRQKPAPQEPLVPLTDPSAPRGTIPLKPFGQP
jgi:DNA-binding helix-hairpin-helix protein with protein kinase domain